MLTEQLEPRAMMAVVARFFAGELNIVGDDGNDQVILGTVIDSGVPYVTVNGVELNSNSRVKASDVMAIVANLGGGADTMNLSSVDLGLFSGLIDGSVVLNGGAGNDSLWGTSLRDILIGEGGNDQLTGNGGNDLLLGGDANDTLIGGAGDDEMHGGTGIDRYVFSGSGSLGSDMIVEPTGDHPDRLDFASLGGAVTIDLGLTSPQVARPGQLTITLADAMSVEDIVGTPYDDTLVGNGRPNKIQGNGGNDILRGRAGNDILLGGAGNDDIAGEAGDDTLEGNDGDDILEGGSGRDRLTGGAGDDQLVGGTDDDTYLYAAIGSTGSVTIAEEAGAGFDTIDAGGITLTSSLDFDSMVAQTLTNILSIRLAQPGTVEWLLGGARNDSNLLQHDIFTVPGPAGTTTLVTFTYGGASAAYRNEVFVYESDDAGNPLPQQSRTTPLFIGNVTPKNATIEMPYKAGTKLSFFIEQNGGPRVFYALPNKNDDGDHVSTSEPRPGEIQYEWEDLHRTEPNPSNYKFDGDFNDLVMSVKATKLDHHVVDLDIDSDNSGPLDRSIDEEVIEENAGFAGKVVAVRGVRVPMIVEFQPGVSGSLALAAGATKVILWTSEIDGEIVVSQASPTKAMGAIPGFDGPTHWTFWVEAIEPSDVLADVAFTLTPDGVPANSPLIETVRLTAVSVDLDTDSNNDGVIDPVNGVPVGTDDPIEEQLPGRILFMNADDDNDNGVIDAVDHGRVIGENDLVELVMNTVPYDFPVLGPLVVTYDEALVRLYAGSDRSGPIASGAAIAFGVTMYAEGLAVGTSLVTVTLSVDAVDFSDAVRMTVIQYPTTIDVDIDSDNNQDFGQPAQSEWEEILESHDYAIGKLIMLDNPGRTVTPIVMEIPAGLPEGLPGIGVRIDWDVVGRAGRVQLWNTFVIDDLRNQAAIDDGGNRIFPGFTYTLADLNYDAEAGRIVIYAEGVLENDVLKTLAGVESVPKIDERIRGTIVVNGDDVAFDEVKYIVANEDSFYYALHKRQKVRNELASRGVYTFADMPKFSLQPKSSLDLLDLGVPADVILDLGEDSSVPGFKAMVYQDYITGEDQYVVAFGGTDDSFFETVNHLLSSSEGDWQNNLVQGLGFGAPDQYVAAMAIGFALANNPAFPQGHLIATGHSLGGGLASAAAVVGGIPADTFNAAWLRLETLMEPDGLGGFRERYDGVAARFAAAGGTIDAYYVDYDFLTAAQTAYQTLGGAIAPVGTTHKLDSPHDLAIGTNLLTWTLSDVILTMVEAHGHASILYGLLVTENSFGVITVDMLGYADYF